MATLELDDVTIGYEAFGSGPAILWIPGGDFHWSSYEPLYSKLPGFQHIGIDPRGVGETKSKSDAPYTIFDMARDAAAVVEHLELSDVTIFGLSMGALVAQEAAAILGVKAKAAIVAGTYKIPSNYLKEWMETEIAWRKRNDVIDLSFLVYHYAAFYYDGSYLADNKVWAEVKGWLAEAFADRPAGDTIDQWQACVDYEASEAVAETNVPFIILAHMQDIVCAPPLARDLANYVKNSTLLELPGGHLGCITNAADEVAEIIRKAASN